MRTRVKICGITRAEDARQAALLGADAIGLVFYPPSPRAVTPKQAAGIVVGLPPFVTVVGLFVDAGREQIREVLSKVRVDLLQFHGDEIPEDCAGFGLPYVKAVRMREQIDLSQIKARYPEASGLLLDTYREGVPGGTGSTFSWERVPSGIGSIVLAGGLSPENIRQAIHLVRPYAVDVSGGVEREKGIKDGAKIAALIREVERADQQ